MIQMIKINSSYLNHGLFLYSIKAYKIKTAILPSMQSCSSLYLFYCSLLFFINSPALTPVNTEEISPKIKRFHILIVIKFRLSHPHNNIKYICLNKPSHVIRHIFWCEGYFMTWHMLTRMTVYQMNC